MFQRRSVAAFFVAGGIAWAAAYDDFSNGQNALHRGDPGAAIAAFSRALGAGDLAAGYLPAAYFGRARAYLQKEQCQPALADVNEALKLRGNDAESYVLRAETEICLNQQEAAFADFEQALRLRPSEHVYEQYAFQQWAAGLFAAAAGNFEAAVNASSESNPHLPYLILWYALAADRAGALDRKALAAHARKIDSDDWPGPLVELYLGKLTAERAESAAADRNTQIDAQHKCEAYFYLAEWQLAAGDRDGAKARLDQAVATCPHDFLEYSASMLEQKRQAK